MAFALNEYANIIVRQGSLHNIHWMNGDKKKRVYKLYRYSWRRCKCIIWIMPMLYELRIINWKWYVVIVAHNRIRWFRAPAPNSCRFNEESTTIYWELSTIRPQFSLHSSHSLSLSHPNYTQFQIETNIRAWPHVSREKEMARKTTSMRSTNTTERLAG